MIASILLRLDKLALFYMLGLNSFYALLLLLSIPELWSHWHLAEDEHLTQVLGTEALPPLSILVPAHNEEMTIADSTGASGSNRSSTTSTKGCATARSKCAPPISPWPSVVSCQLPVVSAGD